ncbi:dimethlysulfonioproprionate lyase DddL [Rhodobacterales bacterium]|nr:dimethlysulfonioproprionate lyase DddL [Rhodobacterales bacterium]
MPVQHRLSNHPDWGYLLREFYKTYRFLSSGGSDQIRGHQRTVREAISRVSKSNAEVRFNAPAHKPVTAHLKRALNEGKEERTAPLIRAIESVQDHFIWQYGYERVPRGLDRTFAYAEICGPNGPVLTTDIILGVVLFAPGCTYPAHAHTGISESYVCLSGSVSENHQGVYAPGSMIFNPPEHMHRITVSKLEPALLAYAWTGTHERLANQKMVFSRKRS